MRRRCNGPCYPSARSDQKMWRRGGHVRRRSVEIATIATAAWLGLACGARAEQPESIPTMIVYAQKQPASLQDVPISVVTLSKEDLAAAGLDDIEHLSAYMPALDLQESVGPVTTTLRIRRVGNIGNIP